ncbi:hypothetical protein [Pendulispora albinea]|uniref:Transposase n=1 Tax=Pendulispora albinea TaxID=2741071 RepID=A0ABZ2LLY9_9BACT
MKCATVENIVREAYRLLGDVEDVVSSSGRLGYGFTNEQASTLADVRIHLAQVKTALRRMERTADGSKPRIEDSIDRTTADEQTTALADIGQHIADVQATLRRIGSSPLTAADPGAPRSKATRREQDPKGSCATK